MTWTVALGVASLGTSAAHAETVADIRKRGTLRLGVLGDQPPWGFLGADGKPAGYDVDFGKLMAEAMGVQPEFVTMTVASRIAQLMTNKVDLVIAVMGMYPERAKVVQFSKPYAGLGIVVLGHRDQKIASVADLRTLRIGVPRGSAEDTALTAQVPGGNILRYDDDASNIQALLAGQVDVIGGSTTYILDIDKAHPGNDIDQKIVLNRQWMGVAMRPGQKELNGWINAFIDKARADGALETLSQKWIGQPLLDLPTHLDGVPFTVSGSG